jgi:protoheme IX farnesyltransferase
LTKLRQNLLIDFTFVYNKFPHYKTLLYLDNMFAEKINAYLELAKPRIVTLILVTTALGYFLGRGNNFSFSVLVILLLGTALSAGGAAVLNNFLERDIDTKMVRTQRRALAIGLISPANALAFGIILVLSGIAILVQSINLLTGFLALLTAFLYVVVYTPLKRITWLNTAIGAIPGAIPPLGGWAAANGNLSPNAWILFLILFIWQHPHFFSIAWMYRDDYEKGGFKMLPVVEPDGDSTFRQIIIYSLLLVPVSLLPTFTGMSGMLYCGGAFISGMLMFHVGLKVNETRTIGDARKMLKATVFYLPLLLGLIVVDSFIARAEVAVQSALPQFGSIEPFTLTDQSGAMFSSESLQGKPWIVNLFFTNCPSVCPVVMKKVAAIRAALPGIAALSVTVHQQSLKRMLRN